VSSGLSKFIFTLSVVWLMAVSAFLLGVYVYAAQKWPYPLIVEIEEFIAGDKEEGKSLIERVKNDLNFKPTRHLAEDHRDELFSDKFTSLEGLPLNPRRSEPRVRMASAAPRGYRLLYGAFDFKTSFIGAILLDPEGKLAHYWNVSQENVDWTHRPDNNVFPHGIDITRDGSIVVAFDAGTSLAKYDYCNNETWRIKGNFHHSVALDNDNSLWTWGTPGIDSGYGMNFTRVDLDSGEILQTAHILKVMNANPEIDIFGILQTDSVDGSNWIEDQWHPNDIEPLPAKWDDKYPGFSAGDLLVSFRSPNLIFVMAPDTFKVKWWRQGLVRRPHDPDWNNRGTISIFNNNMHRGYSSIVEIDPVSYEHRIMLDGEKYDFYTWHQGKHQTLKNKGVLVTSPKQGWAFETNESGDIVFEFLNYYGNKTNFLSVSEARFLPVDFFEELPLCD